MRIHWRGGLLVICCAMMVACDRTNEEKRETLQAYRDDPYGSRPVDFDYSNELDEAVWVHRVDVLNRNFTPGSIGPQVANCGGISDGRNGCTPEMLLATEAKFEWWIKGVGPVNSEVRQGPDDPAKRFTYEVPFPEFNIEADKWEFDYTLQHNNVWSGRFLGVKAKQPGERTANSTCRWFQLQFRNLTDKKVGFGSWDSKLINPDRETLLHLPKSIMPNGEYVAYAATCEEGSIYHPEPGSKIELVWYPGKHKQTIVLPEFSDEEKNWYCHFTLEPGSTQWDVEFEGTK